jgi:hypothetical protein
VIGCKRVPEPPAKTIPFIGRSWHMSIDPAMRVLGLTKFPLVFIMLLSFLLGTILSIISMKITENDFLSSLKPEKCLDCGLVWISDLIIGFLITGMSALIIGIISYIIFNFKIYYSKKWQH